VIKIQKEETQKNKIRLHTNIVILTLDLRDCKDTHLRVLLSLVVRSLTIKIR